MNEHDLKKHEKTELLRISRATLDEYLASGMIPPGKPHSDTLLQNSAAFVTLKTKEGLLRGCIGTFIASEPLYKTIQNMTIAAAKEDPRFPPVIEGETDNLIIEISVLSRLKEVTADEVKVGVHGVFVTRGRQSGVLLPQVPVEYGWSRTIFLQEVCRKAGLPADAYKLPDTKIEVFTAQVFSE